MFNFSKKELSIITACFCGIGICFGLQYSFSIFFVELSRYFNASKSTTSIIFSLTLLIYGIYSPIVGLLVNKFGGRKIFQFASIVLFTGLFLSSRAKDIHYLYFSLGIITAIGMNSIGFIPVSIIISNNFIDKKGFALGISTTGVGVGAAVISIISKYLISTLSWQKTFFIFSILFGTTVFLLSFMLPKIKPRKIKKPDKTKIVKFFKKFLKNKNFWFLQLGMTFGAMTSQSLMLYLVAYLIARGVNEHISTIAISIIGIFGSLGKIFWGYLSDLFNPFILFFISATIVIISLTVIIFSGTPISPIIVIAFAVMYGLGYGSFAPLFPGMAYQKFPGKTFGDVLGFIVMGNGIGACLSTYLIGVIIDKTSNYNLAFLTLLVFISISFISFFISFKSD